MIQYLGKFKISTKVLTLLGVLGLLSISVATYSKFALDKTDGEYSQLVNTQLAGTIKLVRFNRFTQEIRLAAFRGIALPGASEDSRKNQAWEAETFDTARRTLTEVRELRPELNASLDRISGQLDQAHAAAGRAIELAMRDDKAAATQTMLNAKPLFEELQGTIQD